MPKPKSRRKSPTVSTLVQINNITEFDDLIKYVLTQYKKLDNYKMNDLLYVIQVTVLTKFVISFFKNLSKFHY